LDPVPSASELTRNVARLLGRADLVFTTAADGKHYMIERNGQPARNLSEGERTAIALLHFLIGVREDLVSGDEPIVVIDDPVSSLDDSILFGASSYIWSELVTGDFVSQVFLLTHNFELFRQWIVSLENAGRHVSHGYTIHEIRAKYCEDHGQVRRIPRIDPWTSDRGLSRRLRSQYHFLFGRVADAVILASPGLSLAEQMNALALMPNAARKMLESFLSFRFPTQMGDFHGGMRLALGRVGDQSIRVHVERYLHAYSHNEEGDISAVVDPSEATAVLRSLFQLMASVDPEHFSSMCDALELDATSLLSAPGGSASTGSAGVDGTTSAGGDS
jgi:wobble nucleotide-excising tRNase